MDRITPSKLKIGTPKKSDVAEIVNAFCEARGLCSLLKTSPEARKRFPYPRMAARAKRLLEECGGKLGDALWAVEYGRYWL
jgi:hypothetical protein